MNLLKALKTWGLNDKEAKVYLALLELGQTTAYKVAEKSNLKKPTAYVILDQLAERNIVRKIIYGNKLLFTAESPRSVYQSLEQDIFWSKDALPELMALEKEEEKKFSISYYEGICGIRQIYNTVIEAMKEKPENEREYIGFFGNSSHSSAELSSLHLEFNQYHEKYKIKRKAITSFNPTIIENYLNEEFIKKHGVSVKALKTEKYNSNLEIHIFNEYVAIVSQKYCFGTLFKNIDMALVFRQLFEMVWDLVELDKKNYVGYSNVNN